MYIKNEPQPFVASACVTTFDNEARMVVLTVYDDIGTMMQIRLPECMMASVTGQFLKERLFGLH